MRNRKNTSRTVNWTRPARMFVFRIKFDSYNLSPHPSMKFMHHKSKFWECPHRELGQEHFAEPQLYFRDLWGESIGDETIDFSKWSLALEAKPTQKLKYCWCYVQNIWHNYPIVRSLLLRKTNYTRNFHESSFNNDEIISICQILQQWSFRDAYCLDR